MNTREMLWCCAQIKWFWFDWDDHPSRPSVIRWSTVLPYHSCHSGLNKCWKRNVAVLSSVGDKLVFCFLSHNNWTREAFQYPHDYTSRKCRGHYEMKHLCNKDQKKKVFLLKHLSIWQWNTVCPLLYPPFNWLDLKKCPSTARWDREVNDNVWFLVRSSPSSQTAFDAVPHLLGNAPLQTRRSH